MRADREGNLLDTRKAELLDPGGVRAAIASASRWYRRRQHEINRPKQVSGLRNDELDGRPKLGLVLRVNVAKLHLEVRGADVADIREVGARVVIQKCILRTLINLKLRHGFYCYIYSEKAYATV